jgi:hypothetical protein
MFARCQMVTVANVGAGNVGDLEVRKQQPNLPWFMLRDARTESKDWPADGLLFSPGTAATGVSTRGQRFD